MKHLLIAANVVALCLLAYFLSPSQAAAGAGQGSGLATLSDLKLIDSFTANIPFTHLSQEPSVALGNTGMYFALDVPVSGNVALVLTHLNMLQLGSSSFAVLVNGAVVYRSFNNPGGTPSLFRGPIIAGPGDTLRIEALGNPVSSYSPSDVSGHYINVQGYLSPAADLGY